MRLPCPQCGDASNHRVRSTEKPIYRHSEGREAFFERIAGRDIRMRLRNKACGSCGHTFRTVEFCNNVFQSLMQEVQRLEGLVREGEATKTELERWKARARAGEAKASELEGHLSERDSRLDLIRHALTADFIDLILGEIERSRDESRDDGSPPGKGDSAEASAL